MTLKYKHLPSSLSLFRDILTNNVLFVRSILASPLLMYESGRKTKDNTKEKKKKKERDKRLEPDRQAWGAWKFLRCVSWGKQEIYDNYGVKEKLKGSGVGEGDF